VPVRASVKLQCHSCELKSIDFLDKGKPDASCVSMTKIKLSVAPMAIVQQLVAQIEDYPLLSSLNQYRSYEEANGRKCNDFLHNEKSSCFLRQHNNLFLLPSLQRHPCSIRLQQLEVKGLKGIIFLYGDLVLVELLVLFYLYAVFRFGEGRAVVLNCELLLFMLICYNLFNGFFNNRAIVVKCHMVNVETKFGNNRW